jgi:glycosyltransferase involved in cell wall biosynthesis
VGADRGEGRPLEVAVVCMPFLGGAERSLLELLDTEELRSRLALRFVVLGSGKVERELAERGHPYSVLPAAARIHSIGRATASLIARWRREPPDLVLANGVKAATIALPAARFAGVRGVWFKRDFSHDRRLAGPLGGLADLVLAVSPEVAAATRRRDAVVVPPPRPPAPAGRAEALAALASHGLTPDGGRTVATVGRLVGYKGVDDVIQALALPGGAGWRLAALGGSDETERGEQARLERLARDLGVADRVAFLGEIDDAGRLLAGFEAVAVVSRRVRGRYGREGYSRVAAEAMTAGVPVIATLGGGLLARVGGAGMVVPESSPEAIAEALATLADPATRAEMGAAGRALAEAEPSAAESAMRLGTLLAETACRPGAGLRDSVPVSVVTTVLDEGAVIDRTLEVLQAQLGRDDELIVVDGGSRDGTVERIRSFAAADARIRLIESPGSGIAQGRNVGITQARHQVVACTDAGCVPWPGWLAAFRRAFAEPHPADLVTGVYEVTGGNAFDRAMALSSYPQIDESLHPRLLVRIYGRLFGRTFEASLPTGRSVAFSVEAWQAVGGFPEALNTAEDVSFGRSIAATGRRCVLDVDAGVIWGQRPSVAKTARMYFAYGKGGARSWDLRVGGRDIVRALAYPLVVAALVWGGTGFRVLALVASAAYLSLPLVRVIRARESVLVAALIPIALAVKDLSKAAGYIAGLFRLPSRSS